MNWFQRRYGTATAHPAPGLTVAVVRSLHDPEALPSTLCYISPVAEHQYLVKRDGQWVPVKVLSC